ncbi:MAG: VWA domain-containing protein [Rhodanobacteraceae bacterium]
MNLTLHFLRPWWWLALLPLPLLLIALARSGGGRAALEKLADATLLPYLVSDADARRKLASILAAIAWLLAVAALAGPAWQRAPVPLYANGAARVVALSLSNDMLAQDMKPDRMTRARYAVRDLLDAAGDARTALIGYAGDAFVVAPLTPDKQTVLNLLDALGPDTMPVQGNNASRAIAQGVALLRQAQVRGGDIVLATDDADGAAIDAARKARAEGVRVDVLGVGTLAGAPVPATDSGFAHGTDGGVRLAQRDDAALRELAQAGGGRYAPLQTDGSGVAELGAPSTVQGSADSRESAQLWRDGGAWLLLPLLPLAALAFRRGWLCVLALALVAPHARASAWDELWARPDQRAASALQRGDYAAAGKSARDPLLRGAAAYRGGDFSAAAKHFANKDGTQAQYDLGNALAKGGHYPQAIAAYDKALQDAPDMADARANRDAVLAWMKRHPQQQGRQGNNGKQGNPSPSASGQSGSSSNTKSSPGSKSGAQDAQSATQNSAQAGQDGRSGEASGNSGKSADQSMDGNTGAGDSGASKNEDARQREQAQRAQQALRQELAQRATGQTQANAARQSSRRGQEQHAFALGAEQTRDEGKFDPQQRAMLNAVPDDPGALLRRKFLLEWQRRNGQAPEDVGQ